MAYDPKDPLYQLLLDENIKAFNEARAAGKTVDLQGAQFRGIDLRNMNAAGLDMSNAYLRGRPAGRGPARDPAGGCQYL